MFPVPAVAVGITVRADVGKRFFLQTRLPSNILLHKKPSCAVTYRTAFLYHENDRIRNGNECESRSLFLSTTSKSGCSVSTGFQNLWKEHPLYCFIFQNAFIDTDARTAHESANLHLIPMECNRSLVLITNCNDSFFYC